MRADLAVTPGDTLTARVGGPGAGRLGGANGGGDGGIGPTFPDDGDGGGGGGSSDLRNSGALVLAAGGGGGGGAETHWTIGPGGAGGDAGSDGFIGSTPSGFSAGFPGQSGDNGGDGGFGYPGGEDGVHGQGGDGGNWEGGGGVGGGGGGGYRAAGGGGAGANDPGPGESTGGGGGGGQSIVPPGGTLTVEATLSPRIVITYATPAAAPTTTIVLGPAGPDGAGGWYVSGVHVAVSASDAEGSGVAETRCRLDPAIPPGAFGDIPAGCAYLDGGEVATDGHHQIYAASRDNAGNDETPVSVSLNIDRTPPTLACQSAPTFQFGEEGSVSATVSDATSGPTHASVSAPADTSSVGGGSVALTGFDSAGHATTVICAYRVDRNPSTTRVVVDPSPAVVGEPVTATAAVTSDGAAPTGDVQFAVDAEPVGDPVTLTDGRASLGLPELPAGEHTVTATYGGDAGHHPSAGEVSHRVTKVGTVTTLAASPDPATVGDEVRLDAVVSADGDTAGTPTGTVTFRDGDTVLGTVPLTGDGTASLRTSDLPAGGRAIVAAYSGDAGHLASEGVANLHVDRKATETVAEPAVLRLEQLRLTLRLAATLTDADGMPVPGRTIRFEITDRDVCRATTGPGGRATCAYRGLWVQAALSLGYVARFDGDDEHLPSSGRGHVIQ